MPAISTATATAGLATPPPTERLHLLARQRAVLGPPFRAAWERIAHHPPAALSDWAAGSLALADAQAGPGCLSAFWRATERLHATQGLTMLADSARQAAGICREAGAQAALAGLEALPEAARLRPAHADLAAWWRGLHRTAVAAPDLVGELAAHTPALLRALDGAAFCAFVAAGLKHAGRDRALRRAFFTLQAPEAQRFLDLTAAPLGFAGLEHMLTAYATALWGSVPTLRPILALPGQPPARRASIVRPAIRLPEVFHGVPPDQARRLYRAALAHAMAHVADGAAPFPAARLKPLQIVLIGLVEDARVEAAAMRRFPGLRRLWAPFHVARPSTIPSAPLLLARLARALFDPGYADPDGMIAKARGWIAASPAWPDDPAISRALGDILGNDMGQRRLQFDARAHVVEPAYRDDNLGLWDPDEVPDAPPDAEALMVEAARPRPGDSTSSSPKPDPEPAAGRARPVAAEAAGLILATYPEWDRAAGILRPDWTTVREMPAPSGDPRHVAAGIPAALRARIRRLVRSANLGRAQRLKRQADGAELDLDAAIDDAIDRRAGLVPDGRVYRRHARGKRDLAVMVLVDVSASTADPVAAGGASVLEVQLRAVDLLAGALDGLGDRFALRAFASSGRHEVKMVRVKDFAEPYAGDCQARLAGLQSGLSTRLGAALRHAGAEIAATAAHRRLVLVLTDGAPSDIDVPDPRELVEDAARAARRLRGLGVDVVGLTLDPSGAGAGAEIFGRAGHLPIRRLDDLPQRLTQLYFRLSRH